MKKILILLLVLLISYVILGNTGWHLDRNKHNVLPKGMLTYDNGDFYKDEAGLIWELQPQIKNKFHQPNKAVEPIENPYPNVDQPIKYDSNNPNLKFLAKTEHNTSYEAILEPGGTYLTTGKKQGTYNYGHPSGFMSSMKHIFLDVLPHFINSNYREIE